MSITRMADCKHGVSFDDRCIECCSLPTWHELRDERDRYRAALERIARLEDFVDAHHAPAIAREALAGGTK